MTGTLLDIPKSSLTREHILKPALDILAGTGQSVGDMILSKTDFSKIWDSNIDRITHTIEKRFEKVDINIVSDINISTSEKVPPGQIIIKPSKQYARYGFCFVGGVGGQYNIPDIICDAELDPAKIVFKPKIEYRIPIYKILVADQIKTNLLIKVKSRHNFFDDEISNQELKAQNTLRDMLSEADWRRYITCGFVMIKGLSGNWYQIFKEQKHIIVYNKGKKINEICIHTDRSCPRTDHVINMMFLIENDELNFWKMGNIYNV